MLAVILAEEDSLSRSVSQRCRLQGYTVVRYRDPVKLADNLPELKPDVLVVRHKEFPAHGELLAAQLRCGEHGEGTTVIFCVTPRAKADFRPPFSSCHILEESEGSSSSGALLPESARKFANLLNDLAPATKKPIPRQVPAAKNRILDARERIEKEKNKLSGHHEQLHKKQ